MSTKNENPDMSATGEGAAAAASEAASVTAPATALPEGTAASGEEVLLSIDEDRVRLALQGTGFLLLAFLGLFLVAGGIGATQISQNIMYMLLILVGLPLAWFASKAMGQRLGKLFAHVGVIDFARRHVVIYEKADAKKARVIAYKDIKNYRLIRQGKALRLLLAGDWVRHPSGFYLVNIDRPFMAGTLDVLEGEIADIMREHRVNARK